jgi:hypothetical protein
VREAAIALLPSLSAFDNQQRATGASQLSFQDLIV